jgi:hypothetical protein
MIPKTTAITMPNEPCFVEYQVRMEFAYVGGGLAKPGTVSLYLDGDKVGEGRIGGTVQLRVLPALALRLSGRGRPRLSRWDALGEEERDDREERQDGERGAKAGDARVAVGVERGVG